MKKILLVGTLALVTYGTYLILIIAPLARIPFIKNIEFLIDTIVNPIFQIILLLPFVILYSVMRWKDYFEKRIYTNIFFHILSYFIIYNFNIVLSNNPIEIYKKGFFDISTSLFGSAIYLCYHVLLLSYILKTKKISRLIKKI